MIPMSVSSHRQTEFLNVTQEVQDTVRDMGMTDGAIVVFVPHTTAAITINEGADPDVVHDMLTVLEKLVPWQDDYKHSEGNAAAHVKASLFGSSITVLVENGDLQLGTWQKIWFCEFDGPRRRNVWMKALWPGRTLD